MDPASWERLKGVISDAMSRPPGERQAYVRQRCDAAILDQALNLLEFEETRSHVADEPPSDAPTGPDELSDLAIGTRIGQYEIVDRLGRGGMGQVFLGYDHELRRRVALKCLLSAASNLAAERARIRTEAQAAGAITHPNVAGVYHVVEHSGRAFIVMEYVEGESLAARLRRERPNADQVVAIGRQLAAALHAAHARSVIHGDLKPGNIHVTADGSVKVLDFGIARMRTASAMSGEAPTTDDAHLGMPPWFAGGGTPPYMSPEQLRGWGIDERSDIFSLGVVLFEMATGRRPFGGFDSQTMMRAQERPAPRADVVEARVPRRLADVISQALETDLNLRYQSISEIEADLDAVHQRSKASLAALVRLWWPRIALALPLLVLVLGALGVIKTLGFNNNFGRTGAHARFGVEPLVAYLYWGAKGITPKLVVMTIAAVLFMIARIVLRSLALIAPIGRLVRRVGKNFHILSASIGLDNPSTLAQAVAGFGVAMAIGLVWYFADLIAAFQASFNSAPIETLLPMRESAKARGYYQLAFSIVTFVLLVGLFRVLQLRQRQGSQEGRLPVVALGAVIAVTILMNEVPYRSFNYRDFERVDLAGAPCYITGESGDEFLVLCPGIAPPRNRVVKRTDPQLRRGGIIENVFRGLTPVRPTP